MLGVEVIAARKVVVTTAVISMFRFSPGVDIAIGANSQSRVDASGVTRAIYNIGYATSSNSAEQVARAFLRDNSRQLAIGDDNTSLNLDKIDRIDGGSHLRFAQTYKGIPVHQGEVIVSMNTNNEVGMAINNYKNNINLALPTTRISALSAIAAVRVTLPPNAKLVGTLEEALLTIWQDERGEFHIVYRVRLTTENPSGDWEALVESRSGAILYIENRFANHSALVQGSGYAYLTDPLSAAHKRYGSPCFTDSIGADSD